MTFIVGISPPKDFESEGYWFCFQNDRLMVFVKDRKATVPRLTDPGVLNLNPVRTQFLGNLSGVPCYSAEIPLESAWPQNCSFLNLIELFSQVDEPVFKAAVYAKQIVAWDHNHQYCGSCGNRTILQEGERARKCESCGMLYFPRITPAIMVAVLRDNQILLARNASFPPGFFSVLAGFVEPGETLEECILREVTEEVGLRITNLRYFSSQPWPFPDSLMIAFQADYLDGDIKVDGKEIVEADWYSVDNLPKCPRGNLSVAGRLIDWFRNTTGRQVY